MKLISPANTASLGNIDKITDIGVKIDKMCIRDRNMTDDLIKDLEELGYFNCEYVKNEEIYDF